MGDNFNIWPRDIAGLRAFLGDYPMARAYLFHGGRERRYLKGIELIPLDQALPALAELLCLEPDNDQSHIAKEASHGHS